MRLPKITAFDGRTVVTTEGPFMIMPVTYADGGKTPRLGIEEFAEIETALIEAYVAMSGQSWEDVEMMRYKERHKYCNAKGSGKHAPHCGYQEEELFT